MPTAKLPQMPQGLNNEKTKREKVKKEKVKKEKLIKEKLIKEKNTKNNLSKDDIQKKEIKPELEIPHIQEQVPQENEYEKQEEDNLLNIAMINNSEDDFDKTELLFDDKTELLFDDDATELMINENPFYLENANGEKFVFNSDTVTIGKLNSNDISIDNKKVSKRHAEFIYKNEKLYIIDKQSLNGTCINDNKERIEVEAEIEVKENDKVRFANEEFIIKC